MSDAGPDRAGRRFAFLQFIDEICDRFEAEWRAGRPTAIERYLDSVSELERATLLFELVAVEVELRGTQGETPRFEEYACRFPDFEDVLGDVAFDATAQTSTIALAISG